MDLEQLTAMCMALKGTTEDIKWEVNLCFLIGEKMYCVGGLDDGFSAGFKVLPEQFEDLTARPGIIPNKYLARAHWIEIHDAFALSREEWTFYVEQAYEMTLKKLTKKKQREILEN
ncbi:MAG: MmcQ/YjbR family DNA-binding protein [Bacteroidota bacterium]